MLAGIRTLEAKVEAQRRVGDKEFARKHVAGVLASLSSDYGSIKGQDPKIYERLKEAAESALKGVVPDHKNRKEPFDLDSDLKSRRIRAAFDKRRRVDEPGIETGPAQSGQEAGSTDREQRLKASFERQAKMRNGPGREREPG